MFKRILLPVDGSIDSKKALDYVTDIAIKFNSEVIVIYVYQVSDPLFSTSGKLKSMVFTSGFENSLNDKFNSLLEEYRIKLEAAGIKFKIMVEKGKPDTEILKVLAEEKCDLVVMGNRGLDSPSDGLLGNISYSVVHHTDCPLLLAK